MQSKDAIDGVQFGGLDELGMCDSDGEQGTVERGGKKTTRQISRQRTK